MPCCGAAAAPAKAAVTVNPAAGSVTWEGWGTSLAWFAHALGHNPSARATVLTLLFSKDLGLGLNIVRYNIGGADQEHAAEYRPGAAVPCFLQPDGSLDWSVDAGQVAMLLGAAQLGADVFEAFVNSPPWHMTVSGSSRGHQHPLRSNLQKQHVADFAKFCADVVAHFKEAHGITFASLSPFNEPASPAWCLAANCKQEACFFSRRRAHKVLQALLQQPSLQGTQLVAFEQFCIRDTLGDLASLPKDLRPAVGRVATHTYDSSTFFSAAAKPLVLLQDNSLARRRLHRMLQRKWGGVPLWVSEYGTGRGAFKLAKHVVKDIATLLPTAWVYWQAVEGLGSGWGLLEMPLEHPPTSTAASAPAAAPAAAAGAGGGGAADVAAATVQAAAAVTARPDVAVADAGASSAAAAAAGPELQQEQQQDQQQLQPGQCVVHPNFVVLYFLMQALPVGSRVCRVKGFGQRGFAVAKSSAWTLVYVNPSSSKPASFTLAASSLLPSQDSDCSSVGAWERWTVRVTLLHIARLRPFTAMQDGLSAAQLQPAGSWEVVELSPGGRDTPGGVVVVDVPAGCLCRVDVAQAAGM